jgi:hypothetical protein
LLPHQLLEEIAEASSSAAAENLLQVDPFERRAAAPVARLVAPGTHFFEIGPVQVVGFPLFGIAQHVIGFLDPFELFLRALVVRIHVRMVLPRQFAVGLLEIGFGGVPSDAQDLIKVFCHQLISIQRRVTALRHGKKSATGKKCQGKTRAKGSRSVPSRSPGLPRWQFIPVGDSSLAGKQKANQSAGAS